MEIEPDADREIGKVAVHCETKLAPVKPFGLHIFMGKDAHGKGVASEANPRQHEIFKQDVPSLVYKVGKE